MAGTAGLFRTINTGSPPGGGIGGILEKPKNEEKGVHSGYGLISIFVFWKPKEKDGI